MKNNLIDNYIINKLNNLLLNLKNMRRYEPCKSFILLNTEIFFLKACKTIFFNKRSTKIRCL